MLDPGNAEVRRVLDPFRRKIAFYGVFNSLSQTLLKVASPGVPDFYRGSELWDFSLVDPDNRRPVDFALRKLYLDEILALEGPDRVPQVRTDSEPQTNPRLQAYARALVERYEDGRVKLFLTRRLLKAVNDNPEVFTNGSYTALSAGGRFGRCVVAFAREYEGMIIAAVVPRFLTNVIEEGILPFGDEVWKDTTVGVPAGVGRWENLITGETLYGSDRFPAGRLFDGFPVALLRSR